QFIAADEIILPGDDKIELGGNTFRTYEPGIYTLNWRAGESQKLAIQPDYTESDYLPMAYPQSKSYHILGNNWKEGLFLARLGHDIWKYLLIAALLLFLLEIILVKSEEWKAARE
ncbi:MAG: hypothetical protein FJ041_08255, partial [Candidatus Cloacimonetes bacterium]|nr:hypothetical protein [Candidatus Cloacimonadota bacterium]